MMIFGSVVCRLELSINQTISTRLSANIIIVVIEVVLDCMGCQWTKMDVKHQYEITGRQLQGIRCRLYDKPTIGAFGMDDQIRSMVVEI